MGIQRLYRVTVLFVGLASGLSYTISPTVPPEAAELDPYPIGSSFEFFMWPSYMTNVSLALPCLRHFERLYGEPIPVRIGGTTQDRASFDPNFDGYVSYQVDDPLDAPMHLIYGSKYFDLISKFGAQTMIGFNRGDNNRTNTFEASLVAKLKAETYLSLIEIGNEPDLYLLNEKPDAVSPWDMEQEGADAADWAQAFLNTWGSPLPILSGGAYAVPIPLQPGWPNIQYLITQAYNETVRSGTKVYCGHLYALSNSTELSKLSSEMNHAKTAQDLSYFKEHVTLAKSVGRKYILGETGFHGLDSPMDATFGGALQVLDKSLLAVSLGIQRLYFHQGTINQDVLIFKNIASFNWWTSKQVELPFYGSYMAALALNGGDRVIASDTGSDSYAQYVVYQAGHPHKAVLVNTEYYSGIGERPCRTFTLTGLETSQVRVLRMTASSSLVNSSSAKSNLANAATIGGQFFSDYDCSLSGERTYEIAKVHQGRVNLTLKASEALLVYL